MVDQRTPERAKPVLQVSAARRRLWTALNDFIRGQGGWVTSPPFGRFLRIECDQGSSLPVELKKAGHQLRHAGMISRIDGGRFHTVDILELDLGR